MSSTEPSPAESGYPTRYAEPSQPGTDYPAGYVTPQAPTTPMPAASYPAAPDPALADPLGDAGLVPPPPQSVPQPPLYPPSTQTVGNGDAGASDDTGSTKQTAKDEAGKVAGQAGDAAKHVTGVAKEQAAQVADEAKSQVKELWSQTRSELTEQAGAQQNKAAAGLRSLGDQLQSMADRAEEPGVATDLAGQAAERVHEFAGFLENRDPAGLLDEVRSFARRRPGAFLAVALGAGLLTGRLARGLAAEPEESQRSTATATRLDDQWSAPGALSSDRPALRTGPDDLAVPGYPATGTAYSASGTAYPASGTEYPASGASYPTSGAEPSWEGRP